MLHHHQNGLDHGTVHHLEDITAEVDEREEYSNDFESSNVSVRHNTIVENEDLEVTEEAERTVQSDKYSQNEDAE